jgi:hypothetical protein
VEAEHPVPPIDAGASTGDPDAGGQCGGADSPDGAHVQFGLGKAGLAVMQALTGHRDLRVHSGMVTDPLD